MSTKPGKGTLAYTGIKESNPPQIYTSQRDPTVNDFYRYDIGDMWVNRSTKTIWGIADKANNQASWVEYGDTLADISTLTGDVGGAVGPDALDNVNLIGGDNITAIGTPASNQIAFGVSGTTEHSIQLGNAAGSLNSLGVLTNGQLPIGSTGADPVAANLLSADGSITITNGAGSIDLSSLGTSSIDQDQIYYVGKHGNDTLSGRNLDEAVLTFGQALTLATAALPTANNRFSIVCLDNGIYVENITCVQYVDIYAPNASLTGTITCADDSDVKFHMLNVATGTIGVTKLGGGTSYSNIDIDVINCAGTGAGFVGLSGALNCIWKELYVVDGFGIGDLSSLLGHLHIKGGDIYISGTGTGVARANTGSIVGRVDHILDIGVGATTAISCTDGTIDLNVSKIDCDTAYNITGATAELRLFCNELIGTRTTAGGGTSKNWVPQDEMANGTLVIGNGITNDPVVSTLTAGPGMIITNGAGSITLAVSGGGFAWNEILAVSANMDVDNGYIANNAGLVTLTLPATAAQGSMIKVTGKGAGGWRIAQNALQVIHFANNDSTVGVGGRLDSTGQYDSIELVCITANTDWNVLNSTGAITIT